jgi:hypothetical protein
MYQWGYVVGEAIVNGQLRTQKVWVAVVGGDSLPPPPPPDSIPCDSIPTDTIPGGGGGGGGGGGCSTSCPLPDSVVLTPEMHVSRTAVEPVLSPCFDAQTQVAQTWHCAATDRRPDTVLVHIRASYSDDSSVAGLAVTLRSSYFRGGSGHSHESGWGDDSLIAGQFVDLGVGLNAPSAGTRGSRTIIFNSRGDTTLVFRTAGVSGQERIILSVDSATARTRTKGIVAVSPDTLTVVMGGLQVLASRTSIDQIGRTDRHPSNHWGTVEMNRLLAQLADSVAALARRIDSLPPSKRPAGVYPSRLGVNDMSLPNGGLFDIDTAQSGAWQYPHLTHRDGQHADVDIRADTTWAALSKYVKGIWQGQFGLKFVDERRTKHHVHLANQPTGSSAPAGAPIRLLTAGTALCASLACSPAPTPAQRSADVVNSVTVSVDSVWREADRLVVAYHVALGQTWQGRMLALLIQPGVSLQTVTTDAPDHWLGRKATYDGRNTLEWIAFSPDDQIGAGQELGGFVLKTRALLGGVPFLVERDVPPVLTSEEQLGDSVKITPVWESGTGGTILGPLAPLPANPADRAKQLLDDVTGWCTADLSVPRGVCESLSNKAAAVQAAAGSSSLDQLVRVFRAEVNAQRGKHVTEGVYWRLVADLVMVAP